MRINTKTGVGPIGENGNNRSGNPVSYLANKEDIRSCRCFDYSIEVENKEIEPAGDSEVVDEVANSISPEVFFL